MIEKELLDHLKNNLDVDVFMEEHDRNDEFVVIQKLGGGEEDYIFTSTFAVQSYSTSKYNAAVLNELVKSVMKRAVELDSISKVKLNSDYDFTDTETKRYRYQAIFVITHY